MHIYPSPRSLKREPEVRVTKENAFASIGLLVAAVEVEGHDGDDDEDKDASTGDS